MQEEDSIRITAAANRAAIEASFALLRLAEEGIEAARALRKSVTGSVYDEYIRDVLMEATHHIEEVKRKLNIVTWPGDDDVPF